MERISVFMDFANIDAGAKGIGVPMYNAYGALLDYIGQGRCILDAFAYAPMDPRNPAARSGLVRHLNHTGWCVISKLGKVAGHTYKSNVDVEMAMDMLDYSRTVLPEIVVLCSGDGDFCAIVHELRNRNIRIEVAAFTHNLASELKREADGYINLNRWAQEELGLPRSFGVREHTARPHRAHPKPVKRRERAMGAVTSVPHPHDYVHTR